VSGRKQAKSERIVLVLVLDFAPVFEDEDDDENEGEAKTCVLGQPLNNFSARKTVACARNDAGYLQAGVRNQQ